MTETIHIPTPIMVDGEQDSWSTDWYVLGADQRSKKPKRRPCYVAERSPGGPPDEPGWIEFDGDYEKEFYDVRLKDGRVWRDCWPNAGEFANIHGDGAAVPVSYVTHVRPQDTGGVMDRARARPR
jgi:hypothetical protein